MRSTTQGRLEPTGIDARLPTPLYHQIYLILHDKIIEGAYAASARLPSEQELMRMFQVSRITAKRALDELAAAGLVTRARGRGTLLAAQPLGRSGINGRSAPSPADRKTETRLLEFGYVAASPEVAKALDCAPGIVVQRAVRIRLREERPFGHLTTFVPEDIGRSYGRKELASTPLLALLARDGVTACTADQTVGATLADTLAAPALDLAVGAPLLRLARVVRDRSGRAIEYAVVLYRPDRYQFHMQLEREPGTNPDGWRPVSRGGSAGKFV